MTPEIARLVNEGKTVFRLPFKDILRQEEEITRLENRLSRFIKRTIPTLSTSSQKD